jgi:hypothetical protein
MAAVAQITPIGLHPAAQAAGPSEVQGPSGLVTKAVDTRRVRQPGG